MQNQAETASKFKRLMQKLRTQMVEFPFLGQANDIAVTVQSIKSIPEGRKIAPFIQEVACDHLTYFNTSEGLKALSQAFTQQQ